MRRVVSEVERQVLGVRCLEQPRRGRRRPERIRCRVARRRSRTRSGRNRAAHRRSRYFARHTTLDRNRRTRSCSRWRTRAGVGHVARRRTRHRQEHTAVASPRRVARSHAVRERRRKRPASAHARRTARCGAPRPVVAGRDGAASRGEGNRRTIARVGRDRQHSNHGRSRTRIITGQRGAGSRLCARIGDRSQAAQSADRVGRTRHERRWPRRSARARTRGRHRAAVRG